MKGASNLCLPHEIINFKVNCLMPLAIGFNCPIRKTCGVFSPPLTEFVPSKLETKMNTVNEKKNNIWV